MGRKRSRKGGGRAPGRSGAAPGDDRGRATAGVASGPGGGPQGPSRLLLTRLLREGAIWQVYVATTGQGGAPNTTQLHFEGRDADRKRVCYTRPAGGALLDALHNGAPVSRATLEEELERAARDAAAVRAGTVVDAATPGSGPAGLRPLTGA